MSSVTKPVIPPASQTYVLEFQFSSWYPTFAQYSIKSTIIRPLSEEFREYLDADGVFVPEGSENAPLENTLFDDEDNDERKSNEAPDDSDSDSDDSRKKHFAFPELDQRIRECIAEYDGVFPKLNFSSPKDASWLLPSSSPLKCTSPADVYLLLKSSDFVNHDLLTENVFEGCEEPSRDDETELHPSGKAGYELELVLRKWYPIDRGRELRCFVRDGVLLGLSQRDTNFYEFWNQAETKEKVVSAVLTFWEGNIRPKWPAQQNYIFDFLLTRSLSRGHILDFNPYMHKTDPLLFTYEELRDISQSPGPNHQPVLRVIDSPSHPAASKNAPVHQHNMIPFEAVSLSTGRDIEEFASSWQESIKQSTNA